MRKYLIAIITFVTVIMLSSCTTSGYLKDLNDTNNLGMFEYKDYRLPKDAVFEDNTNWTTGNFIDKYGVDTGDRFIFTSSVSGNFSNSATTGSRCEATLEFSGKTYLSLRIWEYGNVRVSSYNREKYNFNVKVLSEEPYVVAKGEAVLEGSTFYIENEGVSQILDCLAKGLDIQVTLIGTEYPISKYYLTFKTSGFATACNTLLGLKFSESPTEFLGRVEDSFKITHWFFIGDTEEAVKNKILKKAVSKYGNDVTVENINYFGEWKPSSLLLYFDLLGWVEKVHVSADVVRY